LSRNRFSIFHFIQLLIVVTIAFRLPLLGETVMLLFSYLLLVITDFRTAVNQCSFGVVDIFCSLFLLVGIISPLFFKRKKLRTAKPFSVSQYVAAAMLYVFLFAPVIANSNFDFQKDISVTRLLPPLSTVQSFHFNNEKENSGLLENFLSYKNEVVKNSFDAGIVFFDSLHIVGDTVSYFQNGMENSLLLSSLILKEGKPEVTNKRFLLGTDELGRDIFTRLIYGARISLLIGFCAALLSLLIGGALGFIAGYTGGVIDILLTRVNDMFLSFPIIFFIILILAFFGSSFLSVIIVLGLSGWMSLYRIVKGEVVALKNKDYFITAQQLGLTGTKLLLKEALPVIATPVIVNTVFQFGNVVLSESALSFLGLGVGDQFPSWGAMINSGQQYLSQAWWMIFFPGAAIVITLLTVNDFGRKAAQYFNPRLHK